MERSLAKSGIILLVFVLVCVLFILFVHISPVTGSASGHGNGTIQPGEYVAESVDLLQGSHYNSTTSSPGGTFDVLILDQAGFAAYQDGIRGNQVSLNPCLTRKNVSYAEVDFQAPRDGRYTLVIDNSPLVEGGASGETPLPFNCTTSSGVGEHFIITVADRPLVF